MDGLDRVAARRIKESAAYHPGFNGGREGIAALALRFCSRGPWNGGLWEQNGRNGMGENDENS